MAHKRTPSDADMPEQTAKVAATEDDLLAWRPPPLLMPTVTIIDEMSTYSIRHINLDGAILTGCFVCTGSDATGLKVERYQFEPALKYRGSEPTL